MNFGLSKQKGLEVTQTQERGKVSGRGNIAVGAEMHTHRRGSGGECSCMSECVLRGKGGKRADCITVFTLASRLFVYVYLYICMCAQSEVCRQ